MRWGFWIGVISAALTWGSLEASDRALQVQISLGDASKRFFTYTADLYRKNWLSKLRVTTKDSTLEGCLQLAAKVPSSALSQLQGLLTANVGKDFQSVAYPGCEVESPRLASPRSTSRKSQAIVASVPASSVDDWKAETGALIARGTIEELIHNEQTNEKAETYCIVSHQVSATAENGNALFKGLQNVRGVTLSRAPGCTTLHYVAAIKATIKPGSDWHPALQSIDAIFNGRTWGTFRAYGFSLFGNSPVNQGGSYLFEGLVGCSTPASCEVWNQRMEKLRRAPFPSNLHFAYAGVDPMVCTPYQDYSRAKNRVSVCTGKVILPTLQSPAVPEATYLSAVMDSPFGKAITSAQLVIFGASADENAITFLYTGETKSECKAKLKEVQAWSVVKSAEFEKLTLP